MNDVRLKPRDEEMLPPEREYYEKRTEAARDRLLNKFKYKFSPGLATLGAVTEYILREKPKDWKAVLGGALDYFLDANKDGKVTQEEFLAKLNKYTYGFGELLKIPGAKQFIEEKFIGPAFQRMQAKEASELAKDIEKNVEKGDTAKHVSFAL